MTLLDRERETLAAAPSHAELVMRLRALVKDALVSGDSPDDVLATLENLRGEDPDREDVILDVMDFVVGWSSPHLSLQDGGRPASGTSG